MKDSQKIPPGQQLVAKGKWPIIGERAPTNTDMPWQLKLTGQIEQPIVLAKQELMELPSTTLTVDIHCVTRWSMLDTTFTGIALHDLLQLCGRKPSANFVNFKSRSNRNHSSSLKLDDALSMNTIIAFKVGDELLPPEHGGPFRNIVPGKYFYKSVKWLEEIELLEQDHLGYWEAETGYHNNADPWKEERYMAPNLDRRTVIRLIESKDFSGHDLRSLDASHRNLDNLLASEALLRDANFDEASLVDANFSKANLSNAHFRNSNLSNAIFTDADVEGANFAGANLRGADFTGCSLIGASFCDSSESQFAINGATIDSTTIIPDEILGPLTPLQKSYIRDRNS